MENETKEIDYIGQNIENYMVGQDVHGEFEEQEEPFLNDFNWENQEIEKFRIDISETLCKPQFLLTSNGIPFSMIEGFTCITGQAGNGKTAIISLLVATILHSRGEMGNLKYNLQSEDEIPTPTVVYIDTEQEKYYTQLFAKRVCAMVGWDMNTNNDRLQVYTLREEKSNIERWRDVIKIINDTRPKPTVVIVDGLLDMVNDPNDLKECTPLIMALLAIATHYKIALWGVIHQNPNPKPELSKMMGNLGSIGERKAGDIICTARDKDNVFTVKHTKTRGRAVADWQFTIDNSVHKFGIPRPIENNNALPEQQPPKDRKQELADKYAKLGIGQDGINQTELLNRIGGRKVIYQGRTADLREAIQLGVMSYNELNKRFYFHGYVDKPQPTQTEIEFKPEQTATTNNTTEQQRTATTEQMNGNVDENLPFQPEDGTQPPY